MHKSQIITEGENVSDKMNENEKKPLDETACSEAPEKVDEPMPETEETSEKMDKKDKVTKILRLYCVCVKNLI